MKYLSFLKPTPVTMILGVLIILMMGYNHWLKTKPVEIPYVDKELIYEEVTANMDVGSEVDQAANNAIAAATAATNKIEYKKISFVPSIEKQAPEIIIPRPDLNDTNSYTLIDYGTDPYLWKLFADSLVTSEELSNELIRIFATDDFHIEGLFTNNQYNHSDLTGFVGLVLINEQPAMISMLLTSEGEVYAFKVFY